MHPSYLISGVLSQIQAVRRGEAPGVTVRNLEVKRDYVDMRDAAQAVCILAQASETVDAERVYNLASGHSTSNQALIRLALEYSGLANPQDIPAIGTDNAPEPSVGAAWGGISRMRPLGWEPRPLGETIAWLADAAFGLGDSAIQRRVA